MILRRQKTYTVDMAYPKTMRGTTGTKQRNKLSDLTKSSMALVSTRVHTSIIFRSQNTMFYKIMTEKTKQLRNFVKIKENLCIVAP